MYKLVVFAAILAVASAAPGLLGAPIAAPIAAPLAFGHGFVGGPVLSAGVVKAAVPVATSYANTVRLASPAVVAAPAPIVAAHAPALVAAHGPALVASPIAHGW